MTAAVDRPVRPFVAVENASTGRVLASRVHIARTPWERAVGLIGHPPLTPNEGLVIERCNWVHMIGMRYRIFAAYVGREGDVLWCAVLRPWQVGPLVLRARTVIEFSVSADRLRGHRGPDTLEAKRCSRSVAVVATGERVAGFRPSPRC